MDCAEIPFIFNGEEGGASHPIGDKSPRHTFGIVSRYKSAYCLNPGSPFAARHFFTVSMIASLELSAPSSG